MNNKWLGIIGAIVVAVIILALVGAGNISSHDSFGDTDKHVSENTHESPPAARARRGRGGSVQP